MKRKELLTKVRKLKKEKAYQRVQTMDGKIFQRLSKEAKAIKINEEYDLDKLY